MSMAIERLTECIRRAVQHAQFRNFYRDRFDSHAMRELYARNLAWKLSDRHEDIAVEALGYIFRSSQARRVLEEMLRARGADVGSIEEVRTQATGKEGARPDLAGVDRTGLERGGRAARRHEDRAEVGPSGCCG